MTDQNDCQTKVLSGQIVILAGHCQVTGRYFEPRCSLQSNPISVWQIWNQPGCRYSFYYTNQLFFSKMHKIFHLHRTWISEDNFTDGFGRLPKISEHFQRSPKISNHFWRLPNISQQLPKITANFFSVKCMRFNLHLHRTWISKDLPTAAFAAQFIEYLAHL